MAVLPTGPVLDWPTVIGLGRRVTAAPVPAVDDLPHQRLVTSGRAAISLGLRALGLQPGEGVWVPSYHCPTLVAAVVHAGGMPWFYGMDEQLRPQLPGEPHCGSVRARALLVPHYFGIGRSLAAERAWCDAHGLALVEDCAHTYFGTAGERPVGAWGDVATASLTKFFPVVEGGLLASAQPLNPATLPPLKPLAAPAEVKGWLQLLARAHHHARLSGLSTLPGLLAQARNARSGRNGRSGRSGRVSAEYAAPAPAGSATDLLQGCDFSRAGQAALASTRWAWRHAPRARLMHQRQRHARALLSAVADIDGVHLPMQALLRQAPAPYAVPVWVANAEHAERAYQRLRAQKVPVFRWDARWRGIPELPHDHGAAASQQLLQLPCHQSYTSDELARIGNAVANALRAAA